MKVISVYSFPEHLEDMIPRLSGLSIDKTKRDSQIKSYREKTDQFFDSLKSEVRGFIKEEVQDQYTGELIKVQHADSYAYYAMINKDSIMQIPFGDNWDTPEVYYWTSERLLDHLERQKALDKLFSK